MRLYNTTMLELIDTLIHGPARYALEHHFDTTWALIFSIYVPLLEAVLICGLGFLLVKLVQYWRTFFSYVLRRFGVDKGEVEYVFLQLVFPASTTKTAYATEQLHILLRSMVKYPKLWPRVAARKQPYSLELVATRDDGIRYVIRIPKRDVETIKRTLVSFLPGLKVKEMTDYLQDIDSLALSVTELKLSSDFVLPLASQKALEEHDPIAYLTGHMRNLLPDELVAVQIVAAPVLDNTHPNELRHIRHTQHRIALNKEIASKLTANKINVRRILLYIIFLPLLPIWFAFKIIDIINTPANTKRPAGNPYEEELGKTIRSKLDQHLFEVTIRVLVASPDTRSTTTRLNAVASSFGTFTTTNQSMTSRRLLPFASAEKWIDRFRKRELLRHIVSQQTVLSSSELSDLYHFPNTNVTKTEDLVKSRSRELATPLSIKHRSTKLDVIVGANSYGDEIQEVGMTLEQRQKHTYIIGKTGMGKTTLLKSTIYQDMLNGKGLAVLDPHGDMFRELLGIIPENRRQDVVVFDPSDSDFPVSLNILDPGIEFKSESDKHEWITSAVLSVFKKLADENQWGPRMGHILENATRTALKTPKPTLFTLQRLLTDKKYQRKVAKNLKDPALKQFWDKEFKIMGDMQMSAATAPLTHRLGHFITSERSRHILLQEETTIRIADIMNDGKILLANLSKGDIGEDQSEFFGTILTSLIWMAAYQRTKIPEKKRRDFFVYVDEFQNFATPQFGAITSEGRKFHVSLIVSHQNIAQMPDKDLVKVIAGNAATIISLRANPEDEAFLLPYMRPAVEKGDIVNLAPYHFYMKVATATSEEAFSGQTVPLNIEESEKVQKTVIASSRKKFAKTKVEVEKHMEALFVEEDSPKGKKQVKVSRRKSDEDTKSKYVGL